MQHDIACAVLDTIQDVTLPAMMESHCRPFAQHLPVAEGRGRCPRRRRVPQVVRLPGAPDPRRLDNFVGGGRQKGAAVGVYEQAFFRGLRRGCDRFDGASGKERRRVSGGPPRARARGSRGVFARRAPAPREGRPRARRNSARGSSSSSRPHSRNSGPRRRGGEAAAPSYSATAESLMAQLKRERAQHQLESEKKDAEVEARVREQTDDRRAMFEQSIREMREDKARSVETEALLRKEVATLGDKVKTALSASAAQGLQSQYQSMLRAASGASWTACSAACSSTGRAGGLRGRPSLNEVAFSSSIDPLCGGSPPALRHAGGHLEEHDHGPDGLGRPAPPGPRARRLVHTLCQHVFVVVRAFLFPPGRAAAGFSGAKPPLQGGDPRGGGHHEPPAGAGRQLRAGLSRRLRAGLQGGAGILGRLTGCGASSARPPRHAHLQPRQAHERGRDPDLMRMVTSSAQHVLSAAARSSNTS